LTQGLPLGPPGMFPGLPGLDPQAMMQLQMSGLGFPPGNGNGGNPGEKPGPPEAAIADIAYLQALMMQMMTGGQFPPGVNAIKLFILHHYSDCCTLISECS
jgi:hypothetical protein